LAVLSVEVNNTSAALALDEQISEKVQRLIDHPAPGRLGRIAGTSELIAHQHYVIAYNITSKLIRVLRVLTLHNYGQLILARFNVTTSLTSLA
jgi:plasmid stabilization system protein ParE